MNDKIIDDRCPYCGGSEFITGKQDGYAVVYGVDTFWNGQVLYHVICRSCGSVVRSYVKKPERLLKRKDRRKDT